MGEEFIMPLFYDIETWKSFVPNIMSEDYRISKENAHQDSMCLTSTCTEEGNKIFDLFITEL